MLYIASDHAGFQLKKHLIKYLATQLNIQAEDLGPSAYVETDDFVDYAAALAKKVAANKENQGILICRTGHGMCMAANKIPGTRAIVGYSISGAELGRTHNDANILCLASGVLSDDHAAAIAKTFLKTNFEPQERFVRRNNKIEELEKSTASL